LASILLPLNVSSIPTVFISKPFPSANTELFAKIISANPCETIPNPTYAIFIILII
jgi:hypothetical protein